MRKTRHYGDRGSISDAVRQALQPSPLFRTKVPKWIADEVKQAIKDGELAPARCPVMPNAEWVHHAVKQLGDSWYDHPGQLNWQGHALLVSEPYASRFRLPMHQELDAFVKLVNADYIVTPNSEHFPGLTFRIVIGRPNVIAALQTSEWYRLACGGGAG